MNPSNSIEYALSIDPLEVEKLEIRFKDLYIHKEQLLSFHKLKSLKIRYVDNSDDIEGEDIFPEWLFQLKSLESLMITGHPEIIGIPKDIDQLSNLKVLDFHYSPNLTKIPSTIERLAFLELINLCGCNISELPPEIGNLENLCWIELQCNQLTSIPPAIYNLSNLEELVLFSNQIASLPLEIKELSKLKVLEISSNPINQDEVDHLKTLMPETRIRFNDWQEEAAKWRAKNQKVSFGKRLGDFLKQWL